MPAYQHTQIGSNMVLILIVVAVGLIGLGVFFSRLTITIEDGSLRAAFGAALTVKSVPLFESRHASQFVFAGGTAGEFT